MRRFSLLVVVSCALAVFFAVAAQAATAQPTKAQHTKAQATTAQPTDKPDALGPAPGCVAAYENSSASPDYVHVDNYCSYYVRVKVVVAFGYDSSCTGLPPNYHFTYEYADSGRFDRLESC